MPMPPEPSCSSTLYLPMVKRRHLPSMNCSAWAKFSPYLHFGSYYRARKGGVASFSFAELPQSPLRYRPEIAPPRKPPHWEWEPWRFRNDVDGLYYDYILVRGFTDPFTRPGPGPTWRIVSHSGSWTLYAK